MNEIKTTENGLEIEANKITLNESKSKYITLAVVEYDPNRTTMYEGTKVENIIVSLPTFCHQVSRGDLITFKKHLNPQPFKGEVLAKETYDVKDDYLLMLLSASNIESLETLPTVETKIVETRVSW